MDNRVRRPATHSGPPSVGGVVLDPNEPWISAACDPGHVPVPSSGPDLTCGVVDELLGVPCTKELGHGSTHRHSDEDFDFSWKDLPTIIL